MVIDPEGDGCIKYFEKKIRRFGYALKGLPVLQVDNGCDRATQNASFFSWGARRISIAFHFFHIMAIKSGRNTFQVRVRTRLIRCGTDPLMSQFADMPVLTVGEVPEFDRFRRIKIRSIDDM